MDWKLEHANRGLKGRMCVNPDKSISHRSVMFASIAEGTCDIDNFLFGEDCLSTLNAFKSMGVAIERKTSGITVHGKGLRGLTAPAGDLYLGNSGTSIRIMSGILAGQTFGVKLTGDASLSRRPMERILDPLGKMGASIISENGDGLPPLVIGANAALRPLKYEMPVASAQVKSCILSAGLYAEGETEVVEPLVSRDHTERMLGYFSADISVRERSIRIKGPARLIPVDIKIPGDISSAAFFIVAALIVKGSDLVIERVGMNPTRSGIINVLKRMGGNIEIKNLNSGMEPEGDIAVRYSELCGTTIEAEEIPLLIDEIPILMIAAALADGPTIIKGAGELKFKETDRIKTMSRNLETAGIRIKEDKDVITIPGNGTVGPGIFDSYGDHRVAMSMAVASLVSVGASTVRNTACVDTSYPSFLRDLYRVAG